jgi:hypothetical protein
MSGTESNTVAQLIAEFREATSSEVMEQLADELAATGDRQVIAPLIYRLCDIQVREDPDVEDAVCGALARFGVMRQLGNLNYRFEDTSKLDSDVIGLLQEYKPYIPRKYSLAI